MARRENFFITRPEKCAAAPMGKMFSVNARSGFAERAESGFGNVAVKKQLHRAAFSLLLGLPLSSMVFSDRAAAS